MEKSNLHQRNKHRFPYDFEVLKQSCPELAGFVSLNKYDNLSVDFSDPQAVKTLNKALLKHFYKIGNWDIPEGYLCPPVPGRADYIHYVADLIDCKRAAKVLDIGVGANCIYPIIGCVEYGWKFTGSDIDAVALESCRKIIDSNTVLKDLVGLRLQPSSSNIFTGVVQADDYFDVCICNPPFHASLEKAEAGTKRKWRNLGKDENASLNFGGKQTELCYEGGESAFLAKMVAESVGFSKQFGWFTTLVSKKDNVEMMYKILKKANAREIKTVEMAQGQKTSRVVVWRF